MCGIAGYIAGRQRADAAKSDEIVRNMAATLRHRGPDDSGAWSDPECGVALGHARLSIIDLSEHGHQPMLSGSGRYVIAYNGEVYNFRELRRELEQKQHTFRGHSDTGAILAAIEEWGVEPAARRFVGMFAFAVWDRQERIIHLVRDRLGKKPLYYGWMNGAFLFGSELKALRACPYWNGEISRDAVALLMRHNYIPAPYSIYRNIYKLFPGTILTLSAGDAGTPPADFAPLPTSEGAEPRKVQPHAYWSLRRVYEEMPENRFKGTEAEALEQLDSLLREAVACRMIADVPLGALLSGGIDSSTVVALMQAASSAPVRTFTVGFREEEYNEAKFAGEVARHLGTSHTELYVTPEEAMKVIPRLPHIYDEPFADSSQIPTFLVCELARRHVTVALSGDAGDENFAGYGNYFVASAIWRRIGWLPLWARRAVSPLLKSVPPSAWGALLRLVRGPLGAELRRRDPAESLYRSADVLCAKNEDALYHGIVTQWKAPEQLVLGAREPMTPFTDPARLPPAREFLRRMMFVDAISYLPDDILVKVDRASMAVSLEVRVPLLDHRVVEFASRLPTNMLVSAPSNTQALQGKRLLRRVLDKYVPRGLVERPKTGFGVPVGRWLRGPLREWAGDLLSEHRLSADGFLDPAKVTQEWKAHQFSGKDRSHLLWIVLMFQAWLEKAR